MKIRIEDKKKFEKAIAENGYCTIGITGQGRTRSFDSGNVHYNVMLRPGGQLVINREGVYDSNRYEVFNGKINSIDQLIAVSTEKCGL